MRLSLLFSLLLGCAPHHLASSTDLSCRGRAATKSAARPSVEAGPASVELIEGEPPDWRFWELLDADKPTQDSAAGAAAWGLAAQPAAVETRVLSKEEKVQQWYSQQANYLRVRVLAEGALLGSLATELSAATGLNVVVQDNLVDLPVSMGLANASISDLSEALADAYGVRASFEEGVLFLSDKNGFLARNFTPEPPPIETVLVPVPEDVNPMEVAQAWCTAHASPQGSASVLDGQILIRDRSTRVSLARELVTELERQREELYSDD